MAITYRPVVAYDSGAFNQASPATSTALTIAAGDLVVVVAYFSDGPDPGNVSITNSGTALSWSSIVSLPIAGCRMYAFQAVSAQTENRTVSIAWDSGNNKQVVIHAIVHSGVHATTPVPAGKVQSGYDSTGTSVSITPTATGSALWLFTADYATTGTSTTVAGANCTVNTSTSLNTFDAAVIRPTTQPRTDGAAFTLSETHTGNGVNWIALEVQAAVGGASIIPVVSHHRRQHGIA